LGSSAEAVAARQQAAAALGGYLTRAEAAGIADRLTDGDHLTVALHAVGQSRRSRVRELVLAGDWIDDLDALVAVLRAVQAARDVVGAVEPLWTMPGHLARSTRLTSSVPQLVTGARMAVTCATYNFQTTSGLWPALATAAARPEIEVRVYLDATAACAGRGTPTAAQVADQLYPARVLQTATVADATGAEGARVRSHAKFIAVDHRFLLVTSANFSWSAEYGNVEFGVLIDDANLTESVERQMRSVEGELYERVPATRSRPTTRDHR